MSINGNPAAECAARRILGEVSTDSISPRLKEVADIIADECKDFYGLVEDYFCESCGGSVAKRVRVAHTADCDCAVKTNAEAQEPDAPAQILYSEGGDGQLRNEA